MAAGFIGTSCITSNFTLPQNDKEIGPMAGLCDECKCANEDQARMKMLEKVIKAQARLLVSYRLGGKPPEWVLDTLAKAKKAGIDC